MEATGICKFYQYIPEWKHTVEKRIPVILDGEITDCLALRYIKEDDEKEWYHYMTTIDVINKNMCICGPARTYGNSFVEIIDTLFRYSVGKIDIRKIKAFVIVNDDEMNIVLACIEENPIVANLLEAMAYEPEKDKKNSPVEEFNWDLYENREELPW